MSPLQPEWTEMDDGKLRVFKPSMPYVMLYVHCDDLVAVYANGLKIKPAVRITDNPRWSSRLKRLLIGD